MPRLRAPAPPPAPSAPPRPPIDPLIAATRIPEWRPLPLPSLIANAPLPDDHYDPFQRRNEPLIARRMSWVGMMSWCWGVVVLLLVISPLAAAGKIMGPFTQPVSAAG